MRWGLRHGSNWRAVPLSMLAFVVALVALPVGTVRASAPDLALTASSATVVPGAQVTLTAAMPVVGAGTVSQEIVQTIDPAKVKLTSVGDISYPSGWVLSYSTDGTTFSPTTPANASAWALVRAVKATGNINSQGAEGGFQIATGTATGTPVSITPGNITASGTGDGLQAFFDPARSRVFNVFHHFNGTSAANKALDCHVVLTGATCAGFPYNPGIAWTSQYSTGRVVGTKIWIPEYQNTGSGNGIAGFRCVNIAAVLSSSGAPTSCATGFVALASGLLEAMGGGNYNYPEYTSFYMIDGVSLAGSTAESKIWGLVPRTGRLVCLDTATAAACTGMPANGWETQVKGGVFNGSNGKAVGEASAIAIWGDRIYVKGSSSSSVAGNIVVGCVLVSDPLQACAGFGATGISIGAPASVSWNKVGRLVSLPDSTGSILGMCLLGDTRALATNVDGVGPVAGNSAIPCWDSSGVAFTGPASLSQIVTTTYRPGFAEYQFPVQKGTRIYWGNGVNFTSQPREYPPRALCWDAAVNGGSGGFCPGLPSTGPTVSGTVTPGGYVTDNYTVTPDPEIDNCMWVVRHEQPNILAIDIANNVVGCVNAAPVRATFSGGTVVPRMACASSAGAIRGWKTFKLTSPAASPNFTAYLSIRDSSGGVIADWNRVQITAGADVDISTLLPATTGSSPSFLVDFVLSSGTVASATAEVKAVGDAPELCLSPTAQAVCPSGVGPVTGLVASSVAAAATGAATDSSNNVTTLTPQSTSLTISAPTISQCGATLSGTATLSGAATGVAGAVVSLLDAAGMPVLSGGSPVTATTAADGTYSFGYLFAAGYKVRFADTGVQTVASTTVASGGSGSTSDNTAATSLVSNVSTLAVGTNGVVNSTYITPAVAVADTSSGVVGATQTINVKANDTAATGNNLTSPTVRFCSIDAPPSGCTLTTKSVASQGVYSLSGSNVVFTPCSGANTPVGASCTGAFSGSATAVSYQITDSGGQSATATITPTVVPAPSANADTSSGAYNTTQTKNVLNNDAAGSGATLSSASLRLCNPTTTPVQSPNGCTVAAGTTINVPSVGAYVVDVAGLVTFTPLASFTGTAPALAYQVQDNLGQYASSTYTPTVVPPGAPNAVADTSSGVVGAAQTKNVLTNDSGSVSGQSLTTNTVRLCGPSQTAPGCDKTSVVVAGVGSYSLDTSNGVVTFTPCNGVNAPVMSPACTGVFTGAAAPLGYQVTSNTNQTSSSSYTPTVVPAPVAAADVGTGPWDVNQTFAPLANDTAGAGTSLLVSPTGICMTSTLVASCSASSLSVANEGTYTLNGDGTVTFDPLPSFAGQATPIRYVVADGLGQKSASTITPTVSTPGAPVATAESKVVLPGSSVAFTNVIGVSALGSGTGLKSGASDGPCLVDPADSVCKTSFTIAGQGSWSMNQSTGVATFVAIAGIVSGDQSPVTYRITDAVGQTATSTLTPRVPGSPAAIDDSSTGKYDEVQSLAPLSNDSADVATPFDVASLKLCGVGQSPPGCDKSSVTVSGQGTYSVGSNGKVTFDPLSSFTGAATPMRYQVADAIGRTTDAFLKPSVTPPPAPVAKADTSVGLWDVTQVLLPLVNDTADAATPFDVASLKLCGAGQSPPGCDKSLVAVAGEGTYTLSSDGKVTFDPLPAFTGKATALRYQVADLLGRSVDSTLTPTVLPPPVARPDSSQGETGERQVVSLTGNDDPGATDQPLDASTVRLCGVGEVAPGCSAMRLVVVGQGTFSVNGDGTLDFLPEPKFVGTASPVSYIVADVLGQRTSSTVAPVVVPPPAPIAVVDLATGRQGEVLVFSPWANDSGGEIPAGVAGTVDVVRVSVRLCGDGESVPKCTQTSVTTADGTYTVDTKTGRVSFVHVPGFVGRVQSPPTYQIANDWKSAAGSKVASSVLIPTILPPATPDSSPSALPDSSQGRKGKAQTLPVLGNDAAATTAFDVSTVRLCAAGEAQPACTATTLAVPSEGTYTVKGDGSIVFSPEPAFVGTATPQRYVVADKGGKKTSSTMTVRVLDQPVPAAVIDQGRAKQGGIVELSPWLNDDAGGEGAKLVPSSIRLCGLGESVPNCTKLKLSTADGIYVVDPKSGKVSFVHKAGFAGEVTEPVNYQIANDHAGVSGPGYAVGVLKPTIFSSRAKVLDQVNWTTPSRSVWLNPTFDGRPSKGASFKPGSVRLTRGDESVEALTTPQGKWEVIRGLVRFTPAEGFVGRTDAVPFDVSDTEGAKVSATLRVTVDPDFIAGDFLPATGGGMGFAWLAALLLLVGVVLRRLRVFV